MSALRDADPPGVVHESVVLSLPAMPTTTAASALVNNPSSGAG